MKATITKVELKKSRFGGDFYYVFLKDETGKSYRSCIYPNCRNYRNWDAPIRRAQDGHQVVLSGLNELRTKPGVVDADSMFKQEN